MEKNAFKTNCPINIALEIWGDRWSLLIIRDLMDRGGTASYGELLGSEEHIATNILSARLKKLAEFGMVIKKESAGGGKMNYHLTEKSADLLPCFIEIGLWSSKYYEIDADRRDMLENFKVDKQGQIAKAVKGLQNQINL